MANPIFHWPKCILLFREVVIKLLRYKKHVFCFSRYVVEECDYPKALINSTHQAKAKEKERYKQSSLNARQKGRDGNTNTQLPCFYKNNKTNELAPDIKKKKIGKTRRKS